jgi:hypothetical protein
MAREIYSAAECVLYERISATCPDPCGDGGPYRLADGLSVASGDELQLIDQFDRDPDCHNFRCGFGGCGHWSATLRPERRAAANRRAARMKPAR